MGDEPQMPPINRAPVRKVGLGDDERSSSVGRHRPEANFSPPFCYIYRLDPDRHRLASARVERTDHALKSEGAEPVSLMPCNVDIHDRSNSRPPGGGMVVCGTGGSNVATVPRAEIRIGSVAEDRTRNLSLDAEFVRSHLIGPAAPSFGVLDDYRCVKKIANTEVAFILVKIAIK